MASKRDKWLAHYLDEGSSTYLNAAESAREAGYQCKNDESFKKIGYGNKKQCEEQINQWLEDSGLSDTALKLKLVQLLESKNPNVQIRALDMGFKAKGLYAAEKRDVNVDLKDKEAKEAVVGFFAGIMGVPDDPKGH